MAADPDGDARGRAGGETRRLETKTGVPIDLASQQRSGVSVVYLPRPGRHVNDRTGRTLRLHQADQRDPALRARCGGQRTPAAPPLERYEMKRRAAWPGYVR